MDSRRLSVKTPYLIAGFGTLLFLIAAVHHGTEFYALDNWVGPLVAFLLDGLPALGLVYAGYWLTGTNLSPEDRWRVCIWCFGGSILFTTIMGLSLFIRAFEGRVVGEAVFPLLLAAEAGGIAGVIAGYRTARARVEARRAQTVSDALGFVNNLIRHDLRNDLSVIKARADLISADASSNETETAAENPSIIAEKADEALARLETTGAVAETLVGEPDLERIYLAAITAEIATRIENTYDIPVTTALPDHAPVTANAGLRSVVDNLLENAVEHNDADEPEVNLTVDTNAETVRLEVADNGPGIPDEQKESILDLRSGETESGGLSLVQTLVEGYGGEVRIEDNDPHGSVFIVELPRADTDQQ